MSLDVFIKNSAPTTTICHCCYREIEENEELYSANITHNLGEMAGKAGIYEALWRPYRLHPEYVEQNDYNIEMDFENSVTIYTKDIIDVVESGLQKLKSDPEYYKQFDSDNGWGTYKDFVPWVENYLNALKENPDAIVETDR